MKPVKTMQKYQCGFCKKRGVKHSIAIHEKRCFRNPDRFCDYCDNDGYIVNDYGVIGASSVREECPYCLKFNKQMLQEIEAREKVETKQKETE